MKITSDVVRDGEMIPIAYTCEGMNVNPPLHFTEVPSRAETLALIVEDPDANVDPSAEPYVHWILYNIPANAPGCSQNSIPDGASEGVRTDGQVGYKGPCPPEDDQAHEYHFRLHALDTRLGPSDNLDRATLLNLMTSHIIEEATLVGTYRKQTVGETVSGENA